MKKVKNICLFIICSIVIFLNINLISYAINENEEEFDIEYIFNKENNTVLVVVKSNTIIKDTKPTWKLSNDKMSYSKTFFNNITYSTPFENVNGNNINVTIEVTQIDDKAPDVDIEYKYNKNDNTVLVMLKSDEILGQTKPTWNLSKDKLSYSKVYTGNMRYLTKISDKWGNEKDIELNITQIDDKAPNVNIGYNYNAEDNTVLVTLKSDEILGETKPTWNLSEDKLSYSKVYTENMRYLTKISDKWGNEKNIELNIKQVDDKAPNVDIEYKYNEEDNTVLVTLKSDEILGETKPTWNLSGDKLSYSKVYTENMRYLTKISDKWGNEKNIELNITQVDDKAPNVNIVYNYNEEDNTVLVILKSDEILGETKPTWNLSEDKLSYSKVYTENMRYLTKISDKWGNEKNIELNITQVDDKAPEINLEYVLDKDVVKVIMHSNEILGETKPTWELSEDKLNYAKIFTGDIEYATPVQDKWGNERYVKIKINTKSIDYENSKGPNIVVKYLYDSNDVVTVQIISDTYLNNTKPTWVLSEDRLTYTKQFTANSIYSTLVQDVYGNNVDVSIIVNFYKNTYRGIDVSEYQKIINWRSVKDSGIDFAIIRCGYRGYGSGTLVTDSYFDMNIREATKVGMDIGIYFYSQAINEREAIEEARETLGLISKYNVPIKYPIAFDTERTPTGRGRGDFTSTETRTEIARAFCQTIENAGYKAMIYSNRDWLYYNLNINSLSKYDVWVAQYANSTDYKYPYTIWQYTSSGYVNGIGGRTDMNIGYKKY